MPDLDPVFERLAAMLREHAEGLVATRDDADQLYLETSQDPAEFFGAVMRKKAIRRCFTTRIRWGCA